MIAPRRFPNNPRCQPSRRQGAAVVEFAIVAPLLFFCIVLPMFEFGSGMMVAELVTNAARAGARVGILPGNTNAAVTATVNSNLSAQGISGATISVLVDGTQADVSTGTIGTPITVTVSIPYSSIAWVPGQFLNGLNLTGTQTLPHE